MDKKKQSTLSLDLRIFERLWSGNSKVNTPAKLVILQNAEDDNFDIDELNTAVYYLIREYHGHDN